MSKQRHSQDFKKMIVDLYQSGSSVSELNREYGIATPTIYKWIDLYKQDDRGTSKADIVALQKRLAKLESENDILKKALTIFAKK